MDTGRSTGNVAGADAPRGALAALDAWAESNPWHPRVLPFLAYVAGIALIGAASSLSLFAYPFVYVPVCLVVAWLLWRYRRLVPELNVKFHWLAIPTGLFLTWAWIELGRLMVTLSPAWFDYSDGKPHELQEMLDASPAFGWTTLVLRLLGMSLLVPLFEELFVRSAVLRGLHYPRPTMLGLTQVLVDMPVVGEWLEGTAIGKRALEAPPQLTKQLVEVPVGHLTFFAVFASTLVFAASHALRDWPGCVACGIVWCALLWWTNRPSLPPERRLGIGPIAWSHGICNAALWYYCVTTRDWQWL